MHCLWECKWIQPLWRTGFPGSSAGRESTCNEGDLGSIPGLGRSPGGGHGNLLQCSCLENPHGQRSLAGYSPRGRKESDTTERLSAAQLWRTVWQFLKKVNIELPYDPAILLLGIYPEKTTMQRDAHTPVFIAALFTIAGTRRQRKLCFYISLAMQLLEILLESSPLDGGKSCDLEVDHLI